MPELSFAGTPILRTEDLKYLGVTLDQRLTFTRHASLVLEKARIAQRRLLKFLSPRGGLLVENRIMLYVLFLRSTLTCNIPVWNFVNLVTQRRLEAFQNKALRRTLGFRPDPLTFRTIPNEVLLSVTGLPTIR